MDFMYVKIYFIINIREICVARMSVTRHGSKVSGTIMIKRQEGRRKRERERETIHQIPGMKVRDFYLIALHLSPMLSIRDFFSCNGKLVFFFGNLYVSSLFSAFFFEKYRKRTSRV